MTINMFSVVCFLLGLLCCQSYCQEYSSTKEPGPIVKTLSGSVSGAFVKVFDADVAEFLGIPFAIPPLGERRFEKPEPVEPWEGVFVANKKPNPCMQNSTRNISISFQGLTPMYPPSEDCLYLNVWSPSCCSGSRPKLPVMVWIYGGGFSSGSIDVPLYDGGVLSSFGEVVVVTFNYRVGAFGYLYGANDEAPGNAGMYDQLLAMKWVKDNIEFFGGDPESITLFGQSAGSISIGLHMISPLAKGLFNRAIMESGSAFGVPIVDPPKTALFKAEMFSLLAGCGLEANFTEVVVCLKGKEASKLANTESTLTAKFPILFTPVYSDEYLPKSPKEAYESGEVEPVEVMAGLMQHEASIFLHYIMPEVFPYDAEPELNLKTAKSVVQGLFSLLPKTVIDSVWTTYFQGISDQDSPAILNALHESYGDYLFNCPVLFFLEKVDNSYLYWMTHRSQKNPLPKWVGATHFDEVPYVFGRPLTDSANFTQEDAQFSKDTIRKWVSFAQYGVPMAQAESSWPKFNSTDPLAYDLNPEDYKSFPYPRRQSCEFWRPVLSSPILIPG